MMFFVFTLVVAVFSMVDNPSIDEIYKSLDVNSAWMHHLVQIWKFYGVDKLRMECILVLNLWSINPKNNRDLNQGVLHL